MLHARNTEVSRSTKVILIVEFVFLAYMLYVLSTSLYKSYQVDRFISAAEEENKKLERANEMLVSEYEYYSSDAYKEKKAKQNFGLVRPGEEVIVLAPSSIGGETIEESGSPASEKYYYSLSHPRRWFKFFFERERY